MVLEKVPAAKDVRTVADVLDPQPTLTAAVITAAIQLSGKTDVLSEVTLPLCITVLSNGSILQFITALLGSRHSLWR